MFWLRNKKNNFPVQFPIWRPVKGTFEKYFGPKKNNCVVRVTAEKTLGRVGRYIIFFIRWLTCWMTKNDFLAENILEFLKPGALLRVHILA